MKGNEKEQRAIELEASLRSFHKEIMPLPGVLQTENVLAFVAQLIDSLHRIEYVRTVRNRPISHARSNPNNSLFDPVRAAMLMSANHREEAFWLVFLATHAGRNLRTEWQLASELYGAGEDASWTWDRVRAEPQTYVDWLEDRHEEFEGKFGNHRKYESLKPGPKGTGAVVKSYVNWVKARGSHAEIIAQARALTQGNARLAFGLLYREMRGVWHFGRTARFDYLTMLGKVGLAEIDADSTYMNEATGPKRGARLLFDGKIDSNTGARTLEAQVALLEQHLGVGMQVMEDSLCNWQKSPSRYISFRG